MPCLDEESRPMPPRLRQALFGCLIIAIVMSVVAMIGILRSRPVQIAWHRWRMDAARQTHYSQPGEIVGDMRALEYGRDWSNYEEHRSALVQLGAAAERHYTFQHILSPTDESRHLLRALFDSAPPSIEWTAPHPDPPAPQTLTVWCWLEHSDDWDSYIAARDVPNYAELFGSIPE
jgi:hypothetical protein